MSKKSNRFSPEVRQRAVRMVLEHRDDYPSRWTTKIRCVPQTLNDWVSQHEVDAGMRDGVNSQHCRCKPISRNTLANANRVRPQEIFANLAHHLIGVARPLYANDATCTELK